MHGMAYAESVGEKMADCKNCSDPKKSMSYCNDCLMYNDPELWVLLTRQFALTM